MKNISYSELIKILGEKPGALPVGLLTHTDARALKTGNPYGEISKLTRSVGFVGAKYEAAVNRECERQGARGGFKTAGLPNWKGEVIPNKVYIHKQNKTLYLRTQSTPGQRNQSRAKVLAYLGDGAILNYEQVAKFLPNISESKKQSAVGLVSRSRHTDDTDNQVWVREYSFDSIVKIRVDGKTYKLVK